MATRRTTSSGGNNMLLLLLAAGGAAVFMFKDKIFGSHSSAPLNPFYDSNVDNQVLPEIDENADINIDGTGSGKNSKKTLLDHINNAREILDTVKDANIHINLPSGGHLNIRKGNKKKVQSEDNFNVDEQDVSEVMDTMKSTDNPLTIIKSMAKVAGKHLKKGTIKNGKGTRAHAKITKFAKAKGVKKVSKKKVKKGQKMIKSKTAFNPAFFTQGI